MVRDSVGHVDGNGEVRHRDVPVSSRSIVLASGAHTFRECAAAKAMDGAGAFGSGDCDLRVAGMGLRDGGGLDLGASWKMGVEVRKHRTCSVEPSYCREAREEISQPQSGWKTEDDITS